MMRLVSLHLSNDRILWGHVLLEDTDNPDAGLAQILVRPIDMEPGYELYDKQNTVLSDLAEPAVRAVIHSGYLEGIPDDMPWQSQLWMYARGEVTREQLSAYADEGRQLTHSLRDSPVDPADVPEDWWRTTQARIRRHLIESTLTEAEAAAALQVSVDDVGDLFESNRLLSFDLEGEERIPDWQLIRPALPELGEPSSLLPGLDVLLAAAPQPLLDAAAMTEFMTSPRPFLTVEDEPLTPLIWLQQGRPLATIIALFRGRRWRQ